MKDDWESFTDWTVDPGFNIVQNYSKLSASRKHISVVVGIEGFSGKGRCTPLTITAPLNIMSMNSIRTMGNTNDIGTGETSALVAPGWLSVNNNITTLCIDWHNRINNASASDNFCLVYTDIYYI